MTDQGPNMRTIPAAPALIITDMRGRQVHPTGAACSANMRVIDADGTHLPEFDWAPTDV